MRSDYEPKLDNLEFISNKKMLINVNTSNFSEREWVRQNANTIDALLNENGALLIRGIRIQGSKKFGAILTELFDSQLIPYMHRSTPRTRMRGNVYTATEYHPNESIPQHNEASYSNTWPLRIGFCCIEAPDEGGETPIADSHMVYKHISQEVISEFESKGLMYVRNYSDIDLPWAEVFQTSNKEDVERYCRENSIEFEWLSREQLRTKQRTNATLIHPFAGKKVWFNQAHLFHVSNLSDVNQRDLRSIYDEELLPRNVYYGDGSQIEVEALEHIRQVYKKHQLKFEWQDSDLLLMDNLLYSHGREPYTGNRKVLVGMARPLNSG